MPLMLSLKMKFHLQCEADEQGHGLSVMMRPTITYYMEVQGLDDFDAMRSTWFVRCVAQNFREDHEISLRKDASACSTRSTPDTEISCLA